MKTFLNVPPMEQKTYAFTGIPIDTSYIAATNELGYWVQEARKAGQEEGHPPRICIKCDAATSYPRIKDVIKTLTRNEIDRFNLLTSLEAVPPGTAAYDEKNKN